MSTHWMLMITLWFSVYKKTTLSSSSIWATISCVDLKFCIVVLIETWLNEGVVLLYDLPDYEANHWTKQLYFVIVSSMLLVISSIVYFFIIVWLVSYSARLFLVVTVDTPVFFICRMNFIQSDSTVIQLRSCDHIEMPFELLLSCFEFWLLLQ